MRELRFTVDAVSEGASGELLASLVSDDDQTVVVPLALLPEGCREGDVLRASFERDPDEAEARRARIRDLQKRLFG